MDQIKASFNKIIHAPLRFDNKVLPEQSPFGIAFSTHLDRDELFKYLKDIDKSVTVYNTIQKIIFTLFGGRRRSGK